MTVCIAAACRDEDGSNRLVFCADSRTGGVLGSAETAFKVRNLGRSGWTMLTAGVESDILALLRIYTAELADPNKATAAMIDAALKEAAFKRKNRTGRRVCAQQVCHHTR